MKSLSMKRLAVFVLALFLMSITSQWAAKQKRHLVPEDIPRIRMLYNPGFSPDGQWVLYSQDECEDSSCYQKTVQVWRVRVDGSQRQQLTKGTVSSNSPVWYPDGKKIAYLSPVVTEKGPGPSQVFMMPAGGGTPTQVTSAQTGVLTFEFSRDGKNLLYTSIDPYTPENPQDVGKELIYVHLWVLDIERKKAARLTQGKFEVFEAHWSPDSSKIVYVWGPNTSSDEKWNRDLWIIDPKTRHQYKLFHNPGPDINPRWSPDGKTIVFAMNRDAFYSHVYYKMVIICAEEGGLYREYLQDFDLDFSTPPTWSPDGKKLYWQTGDHTIVPIFSFTPATGKIEKIMPRRGVIFQFALSADGSRWAWTYTNSSQTLELYTSDSSFKKIVRLSDINPWIRNEKIKVAQAKVIRFKNSDNQWLEAILTLPVDYQPGKKYPLVLFPHGGPVLADIEQFNSTSQLIAGNGFMVLQVNFRGSSNYGQKFITCLRGKWALFSFDDCMTGVDYCINEGWADPERLICFGWSYGGYMGFWIATKTDRFKGISPGGGLTDLFSEYANTTIPHNLTWWFGSPWDNAKLYRKLSPITYVKNVNTPVMIMHSKDDPISSVCQPFEFYQALKDLDKEVSFFLYLNEESHTIDTPALLVDLLTRYITFFKKQVGMPRQTSKK